MLRLFPTIALLCLCQILMAQNEGYFLEVEWFDEASEFELSYRQELADSLSVISTLENLLEGLRKESYLAASVDSIYWGNMQATAYLYRGPAFQIAWLRNGNIPEPILRQAGYRERAFEEKPFSWIRIKELQGAILEAAENSGYPLAQIRLDSARIEEGRVSAALFWEPGPLMVMEKLGVEGDANISTAYLENYLGLRQGQPFNRKKLLTISNRIGELPFLKETKAPTISFIENKSTVILHLERQKASRFDFLLGILPTRNEGPNQRILLTGSLEADLRNQFGFGEQIRASFEQLRPGTQELEVAVNYPYVLQIPFGLDLAFNQYKRDSSYSDVIFDFGVRYLLEGGNYIKAFWNTVNSNLLTVNEQQILNQRTLPAILDVRNQSFGLEYLMQQLDYRRNPRKGWGLFLRTGAGFKTIRPNNAITDLSDPSNPTFDFKSLYDTLDLRTFQFRINGRMERFFPLFGASTLMLRGQGGYIYAPTAIYRNEQFRIGGNRLLRGFDEESLFVTLYAVFTLEYRLLIDRNSFFFVFGDYSYVEDVTATTRRFDRPFGLGAGLSFSTRAGQFGLSLAVGSQQGDPLDWQNPKVHLGYLSFF